MNYIEYLENFLEDYPVWVQRMQSFNGDQKADFEEIVDDAMSFARPTNELNYELEIFFGYE